MGGFTVLVCDDDDDISSALQIYLRQEGYDVVRAANGLEAVSAVERGGVHLVLLDVMMPVMDGITAAVRIREASNAPILFLSAKSEDADRILGLTMGGDDYITKPFNPVELLARVRAALRRYVRLGGMGAPPPQAGEPGGPGKPGEPGDPGKLGKPGEPGDVHRTGGLTLDAIQKRVTLDGEDVALTALEYKILNLLMANMGRVYSSEQIYEAVWAEPAFNVSKTVSVHIRHIREKIEINPKEPRYLMVVYGLGYKVVKVA